MFAELAAAAWITTLVFARVGALAMLLPGIGEAAIPAPVRLAFALALAVVLAPGLADAAPPMPTAPLALTAVIGGEVVLGLAFGLLTRFFYAAVGLAGQIIGLSSGLSMAMAMDPAMGQQGSIIGVFLNLVAIVLLFATGLHHVFLAGIGGGYALAPPGVVPPLDDFALAAATLLDDVFALGIQMAAPLVVYSLVFNAGIGVLSKLMPQAQIFMIAAPSTILVGFILIAASLGGMMLVWLDRVEDYALQFT